MNVTSHSAYSILIQGEKGDMTIGWPPYRPTGYTLHLKDDKGEFKKPEVYDRPIPGHGMFWEADGCARALRDGKKESELCPLSTTLLSQKVMDKVRKDGDFSYPEKLEAVRSDA
jgi:dihydrodiol dehydrogenase / D-xylose 1-dehydrogenase (NADP)